MFEFRQRLQHAKLILAAIIAGTATIQFRIVVPKRSKSRVIQSAIIAMGSSLMAPADMNLTGFRLGQPFMLDYVHWKGIATILSLRIPGLPLK